MSRRNFGHQNGFKTSHDLQVMNFLARKNCTFSTLFHYISQENSHIRIPSLKNWLLSRTWIWEYIIRDILAKEYLNMMRQVGLVNFLENMGGQILGYNSCPCSIFLDLRMQIGGRAFRNLKVEDDWTLECPEICAHIVAVMGEWAYRCHLEIDG